jgi:hypothetical protein
LSILPLLNDISSGEGEGELVERVASGEKDGPVMVDKVDSREYSAEKMADDDGGTGVWED